MLIRREIGCVRGETYTAEGRPTMAVQDVAKGLVDQCRSGQFNAALTTYYADDIVSVEPTGDPAEVRGIQAVKAKTDWWDNNFDVHEASTYGPYINGDQFAVRFEIDATNKASGQRSKLEEVAVYTVRNDKIVHERFFNLEK
jgi:ketosteroid isomerase-like protein